jgi:hypothetical protein
MADIVTVIFNDNKELILLKLQAYSFHLVDEKIINNIYIVFNDSISYFENFKINFYEDIINYYPKNLLDKIKILNIEDIGLKFNMSSWFTQQIIKIKISNYVESKYYIVLDGKNHFKEKITYNTFFDKFNKPKLAYETHGDAMLKYYFNCLEYFGLECPINHKYHNLKIQTITPFIFIKDVCSDLINFIENKEKTTFYNFIDGSKKYTEFFLYYSFLVYSKKTDLYNYSYNTNVITIGAVDPKIYSFNSWDHTKNYLMDENVNVISFHRGSLQYLDNDYKDNLYTFYENYYKKEKITNLIKSFLYD